MATLFMPTSIGTANPINLSASLYGAVSVAPKPIAPRPKLPLYRTGPPDNGYKEKHDYDDTDNISNNSFTVNNDVGNISSNQPIVSAYDVNNKISKNKPSGSLMLLLVVIILTIIIFVAVLSVYDLIKEKIIVQHAKKALLNPRSRNTSDEIERTLIANRESYNATMHFSVVAIFIAVIFLPFLFYAYILLSR
jgi:hypothetical protein